MGQLTDFLDEIAPKGEAGPAAETQPVAAEPAADQGGPPPAQPEVAAVAPPAVAAPANGVPPAPGQESKGQTVPLSALEDERAKRKDWKARAIRLEEQMAQVMRERASAAQTAQQPAAQPQAPQRIDVLQDPEGYQRWVETQLQTQPVMIRRDLSEAALRRSHQDAEEVMGEFVTIARSNPVLVQQMDQQIDPAQWAYDYVKRSRLMQEIGADPEAWKAQQLEALKSQWLAEAQAQQPVVPAAASNPKPNPVSSIPPSLANARNVGARTGPAPSAPSFDETFAKKY